VSSFIKFHLCFFSLKIENKNNQYKFGCQISIYLYFNNFEKQVLMKLVVDENIVKGKEAFSQFGDVQLVNGREITHKTVQDADVLITRSVTKVNKSLLHNSKVKFVGTATIGTDHVDSDYLESQGIYFANAPGCNSSSVAEYVFAGLSHLSEKDDFHLKDKSIGIVGIGNIGSKVLMFSQALGMKTVINDPPLERNGFIADFSSLDEVLKCDIVTLHVPLNKGGIDNTFHLIGKNELEKLQDGAILINTSRGEVVDNIALNELAQNKSLKLILDVWENEPNPIFELITKAEIATPHIAGYSYDGKLNGTKMVFEELNKFMGLNFKWNFSASKEKIVLNCSGAESEKVMLNSIYKSVYNILEDDKRFRDNVLFSENPDRNFDLLRKNYPKRLEFCNFAVKINDKTKRFAKMLSTFGLTIL
jgi:erythronate-4-phosphate dehydrogenase